MSNVIIVIDGLGGGGAERVALTQATAFQKIGYDVTLVLLKSKIEYSIPDGIQIMVLKSHKDLNGLSKIIERAKLSGGVACVLSHLPRADKLVSRLRLRCSVLFVHNNMSSYWVKNKKGLSRWNVVRKIRRIYSGAKVACVSDGVKNDFISLNIHVPLIETIYNPFNIEDIKNKSREYDPGINGDYVLHVGRFDPQKRHDILLEAYRRANLSVPLVLLGKGDSEPEIRKKVIELGLSDKVIFAGFSANPYPWMRRAKFLCLSSEYEGLPTVLIESLICGTPIVSFDCPSGPKEILIGDLRQYLIPYMDIDAMANGMERLLACPLLIDESYCERFSDRVSVQKVIDLAMA